MALASLNFSEFFKDKILSGEMRGTILTGEWDIPYKHELLIYISKEGNVEDNKEAEKIGKAKITKCKTKKVEDLTDKEAEICAYPDAEELKNGVKKWHGCESSDVVTFIKFDFTSF